MAPALLTPAAAARAKQLELFARTRVEGFLKSHNRSPFKGHSTDFLQHRAYFPGDDLRTIDWRVYARSDRLVTRLFEEHTNLDIILAVDASGSMGYPPGPASPASLSKLEYACRCAALIAFIASRQRDRVGLATVNRDVTRYLRPGSGKKHLARLLGELSEARPAGETDFAAGLQRLAARTRRRSLLVLFSDCYQDPAPLVRALGLLRVAGHDAILFQVADPAESDLPFAGFTLFRDLEDGQIDPADPLEIRDAYRHVVREHLRALREGAARHAVEFHPLVTSNDWDITLATLLRQRERRR